jgi:hypothetical protein
MVDPASSDGIAAGLRSAWDRAGELGPASAARAAEFCDPFKALVGILSTYQEAAARAVS